jgi:hypothetical protein
MVLKEGKHIDLIVAKGVYFPEPLSQGLMAYQLVNKKTGIVEFEEVQLAAAWEAFGHFDIMLGEVYDAIDGKITPSLTLVGADEMPPEPTLQ